MNHTTIDAASRLAAACKREAEHQMKPVLKILAARLELHLAEINARMVCGEQGQKIQDELESVRLAVWDVAQKLHDGEDRDAE